MKIMTEEQEAMWMANKALDVPNADPDDDLRTISRHFLRSIEQLKEEKNKAIEFEKGITAAVLFFELKEKEWENENVKKAETFGYCAHRLKDLLQWIKFNSLT